MHEEAWERRRIAASVRRYLYAEEEFSTKILREFLKNSWSSKKLDNSRRRRFNSHLFDGERRIDNI